MLMMQPFISPASGTEINIPGEGYYHIAPYDYYVKEYFLAKSLLYVLGYIDDDILFQVALEEASQRFKVSLAEIMVHINKIRPTLGLQLVETP